HYYCGHDSHMEVLLSDPAKQPRLPDLEREAKPTWCTARRLAEGPPRELSLIDRWTTLWHGIITSKAVIRVFLAYLQHVSSCWR
ncbi:hypothetical protein BaRGS_00040160, partial [Batillaria attramentaria]